MKKEKEDFLYGKELRALSAAKIDYAVFKYATQAIELKSASPTISNSLFSNANYGITMNGVSEPVITGNTFHDLNYSPFTISLVAYPSLTENNLISGKTWKMISVNNNETLTQDVELPRRDFGGVANIPYNFYYYTVGTGAVLTIDPGVVIKFRDYGSITVQKGLIAKGKEGADSTIVFTTVNDDFYGGDSNSDGDATSSDAGSWQGIIFQNTSIDASSMLSHAVFKNTGNYTAVTTNSASPTITYSAFINVEEGVKITGSSNPIINYNDFYDVTSLAVNNVDKTFTVDATNNWWGDDSGPTHVDNVDGVGEEVTDGVTYDPWIATVQQPIMGDVSLNGRIQAYDASLILQHAAASIILDANQMAVADVSDNGGLDPVTAFDASLILQFTVGLIDVFEAEASKGGYFSGNVSDVGIYMDDIHADPGDEFTIPVRLSNVNDVYALQAVFSYDSELLTLKDAVSGEALSGMSVTVNGTSGKVYIAAAGTTPLKTDGEMIYMTFRVNENVAGEQNTLLKADKFLVNDLNLTDGVSNSRITVYGVSGLDATSFETGLTSVYPNPMKQYTNISFNLPEAQDVTIRVYNSSGQVVSHLAKGRMNPGSYTIQWDGTDSGNSRVEQGIYYIRFQSETLNQTRAIQVIH